MRDLDWLIVLFVVVFIQVKKRKMNFPEQPKHQGSGCPLCGRPTLHDHDLCDVCEIEQLKQQLQQARAHTIVYRWPTGEKLTPDQITALTVPKKVKKT